jgi:hypothetical protein
MFGYYKFSRKIKACLTRSKYKSQIEQFNFSKNSDELYLFGNGYTLKGYDLNQLINQDCFICNGFFRMPNFNRFIQNNNVLDFSMDSMGSIIKSETRLNRNPDIHIAEYINPKIGIGIHLVRTIDAFDYILRLNPGQKIIDPESFLKKIAPDNYKNLLNDVANKFGHTPQFMLLVGLLMGYQKIHLFGLEHNYVRDMLNKSPLCGTHFYNDTYEDILLSDGHPRDRELTKPKLSKLFSGNASIFAGYEQLADLAKELGVEVIDHSNGSLFMFQDYSLWDLVERKNIK